MVCTDAAARGLDLPDVTHVVQADFALSAIDFLHRVRRGGRAARGGMEGVAWGGGWSWWRTHFGWSCENPACTAAPLQVGRTARAGKSGRVTSLYSPENADLVVVIRAALDAGGCYWTSAFTTATTTPCTTFQAAQLHAEAARAAHQGCRTAIKRPQLGMTWARAHIPVSTTLLHAIRMMGRKWEALPAHTFRVRNPGPTPAPCRRAGGGRLQPQALLPQEAQAIRAVRAAGAGGPAAARARRRWQRRGGRRAAAARAAGAGGAVGGAADARHAAGA